MKKVCLLSARLQVQPLIYQTNAGMEQPYNISIYPGTGTADGVSGDHVLLAPAYTVNAAEVEQIVDLTTRVIEDVFSKLDANGACRV